MKTLITGLALVLGLSCGAAFAGDPAPAGGHEEHGMDHDKMHHEMHDMSPAELQKMIDERFASIDTNKDGSISKDEFTKHHEMMMTKHKEMEAKEHEHTEERK